MLFSIFWQFFRGVTAHNCHQKTALAQYLVNELTDFGQILHIKWNWQYGSWHPYVAFSVHCNGVTALDFHQKLASTQFTWIKFHRWMILAMPAGLGYCPWLSSENGFRSISCERKDGFWSYFTYRTIVIMPHLGLLFSIICQFPAELLPLFATGEQFPFIILWRNWQISIKLLV